MASGVLAILGPSGVGKSDARKRLCDASSRFEMVKAWTTRPLRSKDVDRQQVHGEVFETSRSAGELLAVNSLYGALYGTPIENILLSLEAGRSPVLDWPLQSLHELRTRFPAKVFSVYLMPPSLNELRRRLDIDGRDPEGTRYSRAAIELRSLDQSAPPVEMYLKSEPGRQQWVADTIAQSFESWCSGGRP